MRSLLLLCWIQPFFVVFPEALAAPYTDSIGAGTPGLGLFMAAMPVGTVLGELLAGAFLPPAARARLTVPLAACSLLPYALFALRPSLPLAVAAMFTTGLTAAYTLGLDQWFVAAVPEGLRGRAMTLQSAGLMTIQGLGMAVAGAAAEFVRPHAVTAVAGVWGRCASCWCWRGCGGLLRPAGCEGGRGGYACSWCRGPYGAVRGTTSDGGAGRVNRSRVS